MSERLSDKALDDLLDGERGHRCYGSCCADMDGVWDALAELRERRALDEHRRKSDEELIERRAADLTGEEREALEVLADRNRCAMFGSGCTDALCAETQAGVTVLSRLLDQKP